MAFTSAELKAIATLDNKQFQMSIAQIEGSVQKLGSGALKEIGGMIGGAFAVGAIVGFGKQLMQEQATMERFSKTVGISAGMLDELGDKAAETGADAQGFTTKITKMVEAQEKAVTGNKDMVKAFAGLGISMKDLLTLDTEGLLVAVARGGQTSATAIHNLNEVMGRGAAGEYGATLRDIAANGLPKVSSEAAAAERQFSLMNRQLEIMKDKAGHALMETVSGVGRGTLGLGGVIGGAALGAKIGSIAGLSGTIAGGVIGATAGGISGWMGGKANEESMAKARLDLQNEMQDSSGKAGMRLRELQIEHEKVLNEVRLEGAKKQGEVTERTKKATDHITVSEPKAADAMAAYGRMIGGQFQGTGGVAERQLKELEIIAETTKEMTKIQDETNKKIADLGGE